MRRGQKTVEHWKPTKYGYLRMHRPGTRQLVFVHVYVWEQHYGPKPKKMDIHHKDENKLNNDISNLELMTRKEHKRHHSPLFSKRDGIWWKFCRDCDTWKVADKEFYTSCRHSRFCKLCWSKRTVKEKQQRRERSKPDDGTLKRPADDRRHLGIHNAGCHSGGNGNHNHGSATPGAAPACDRGAKREAQHTKREPPWLP